MEARYRFSKLAKLARCQVVTVRYYEKEGLLPATGGSCQGRQTDPSASLP